MDKKRQGYAAISRSIQDNFLWLAEPFTKGQAWIDLILYANWKDTQELDRGEVVTIKRGQFYASDGFWVERWQWSRNKVRGYFALLEKEGMIERSTSRRRTIYTLINYNDYQPSVSNGISEGTTESTTEGTTERITDRTTKGTSKGTQHNNIKQVNKEERQTIDDDNMKKPNIKTANAREDGLNLVDLNRLVTVFGENFTEKTKQEYLKMKSQYDDEVLHSALEKTMILGGVTIAYTQKILKEMSAARV